MTPTQEATPLTADQLERLVRADGYLRRMMVAVGPMMNLLDEPDLFATQIDNFIVGLKARAEAAESELAALQRDRREWMEVVHACATGEQSENATQRLVNELAALRANQRTPGSVETCPQCNRRIDSLKNGGCGMMKGPIPCPIRPQKQPLEQEGG